MGSAQSVEVKKSTAGRAKDQREPKYAGKGSEISKHHLVVGIDFGTTFSGVAFCRTSDPSIDNINVITRWTSGLRHEEKVPTEICFLPFGGFEKGQVKWGYDATPQSFPGRTGYSETPIYSRFKLLLDPETGETNVDADSRGMATDAGNKAARIDVPAGMTALELTSEYLKQLHNHIMPMLRTKLPPTSGATTETSEFDSTPIQFIATVPAIWKHRGQEATRAAFRKAGFGVRRGSVQDTLTLVSEPEAAALYALRDIYRDDSPLAVGDQVMIVDAGGGTVDVITYNIVSTKPTLKLGESVIGSGDRCGSSFVDENLYRLLRSRLGASFDDPTVWTPRLKGRGSELAGRIDLLKRSFDGSKKNHFIHLPVKVRDNERRGIVGNVIELTSDDIARCFNPVINKIFDLLEKQVTALKDKGCQNKLKAIILAGGFGESSYLLSKIQQWKSERNPRLDVLSPAHPWSAVARGAVLYGLNEGTVKSRKLRTHYGIGMNVPFNPAEHEETRSFTDPFEGKLFENGVKWLANLGQDVTEETTIKFPAAFVREEDDLLVNCAVHILGCKFDDPPKDITSYKVDRLGTLNIPILPIPIQELERLENSKNENEVHYRAKVEIEMKLKSAEAIFRVVFKKKTYGIFEFSHNL